MKIYKDKNFKIEQVEINETIYDSIDESAYVIYESEKELKRVDITINELADIEMFNNPHKQYLYMYSHRGHRNWVVDGFLPIDDVVNNVIAKIIKPSSNNLRIINALKNVIKQSIKDNKVDEIYNDIMENGCDKDTLVDCDPDILVAVIEHMGMKLSGIKNEIKDVFYKAEADMKSYEKYKQERTIM